MTNHDEGETTPGHHRYQPIIERARCPIVIPGWNPSLVRRNPSPSPLPSDQTSPEMLWTFRNHPRNIPCGLSVTSSHSLEHPQRFSCVTPISLSRNGHTRAQLLEATT